MAPGAAPMALKALKVEDFLKFWTQIKTVYWKKSNFIFLSLMINQLFILILSKIEIKIEIEKKERPLSPPLAKLGEG